MALTILLADDHAVVRQGYGSLLAAMIDEVQFIEAGSGTDAALLFFQHAPDILILDVNMADMSGIEVCRQLIGAKPDARILIFSMYEEATVIREALNAGALGYLSKSSPPAVMLQAVTQVAAGQSFMEPRFESLLAVGCRSTERKRMADPANCGAAVIDPLASLATREREIAERLLEGKNNQVIATELGISAKTVANRATVIRQKFGVGSTAELMRKILG
ncbi:response regulator transcription factor [Oceanobacter sp. 4_MG-2023]|jgi:DNA-binding NarL/FixJ family response regulator|uniref:response regulator transcription factor n=1 Tax=Oceanobacter sp. 4_MG-2023 TaxID=3062623 RepID=UPI002734ED31|nr:response regulator transcription factor [Oceanobacter sp. 4_MG-2023]MDP2546278.1 response regulator transcription factor [Oceanobacter sp. 4_MG-2023]